MNSTVPQQQSDMLSNSSTTPFPRFYPTPSAADIWADWGLQICLYTLILFLTVLGNVLVIVTLIQNTKMRTVTNVYLLNLSISDMLLGVFCMPFTLVGSILQQFIFGGFMCKIVPYFQGDYKASDYERFRHCEGDYGGPFDLDADHHAVDLASLPRDYSPARLVGDVGEDDFWARQQRCHVYRRREISPRRILAGDYHGYLARDGEKYRRYREGRGRIMSREFSRLWGVGSLLSRWFGDEEYRQRYSQRRRSLSPVPPCGYSRPERAPEAEPRPSARSRSMTPAGRREKVTRHRIEPEHSAQQASNTSPRYRRDREARRESSKEPEAVPGPPEVDDPAKEDNETTEQMAARD